MNQKHCLPPVRQVVYQSFKLDKSGLLQKWLLLLKYGVHFTLYLSLNHRVIGAPQTTSQPVSSVFLCSPLPSRIWQTPGCPFPDALCLSALYFVPLLLCLARWVWPDLMNGRHDHTTAVCVSLRSSGLCVVQLPAGAWHGLPRW